MWMGEHIACVVRGGGIAWEREGRGGELRAVEQAWVSDLRLGEAGSGVCAATGNAIRSKTRSNILRSANETAIAAEKTLWRTEWRFGSKEKLV